MKWEKENYVKLHFGSDGSISIIPNTQEAMRRYVEFQAKTYVEMNKQIVNNFIKNVKKAGRKKSKPKGKVRRR